MINARITQHTAIALFVGEVDEIFIGKNSNWSLACKGMIFVFLVCFVVVVIVVEFIYDFMYLALHLSIFCTNTLDMMMLVVYVQYERGTVTVCVHAYECVFVLVCWYCIISCAANRIEYNEELVDDRCFLIRSTRIHCMYRAHAHIHSYTLIVLL